MKKILVTGSLAYDFIMRFGDIFANHILPDKLHILNVSFTAHKMSKNLGGTGGNIAYSLALLEESPILFGTAGRDFGEYQQKLASLKIDTSFIHIDEEEWTASAHIITDQNDNQITAFYGGAMLKNDISIAHILDTQPIAYAVIAANGRDGMLRYVRELKAHQIPYVYDPGQSLPCFGREELRELTIGAYMIVTNEYEKQLLLNKAGLTLPQLCDQVQYLIVTNGEKGSVICTQGKEITIPAAKANRVLDPTGAGDAYRGGLLKGMLYQLPIEISVQLASIAGCYAVEEVGTQTYSYSIAAFQQRFRENYGDHPCLEQIFKSKK